MKKLGILLAALLISACVFPIPEAQAVSCKKLPLNFGVSAGHQNSFGWDNKGFAWAWGRGDYGQRGIGLDTLHLKPSKVESLKNVVQISSGALHTLFLTSDGSVYSSGDSGSGQLGLGATKYSYSPKKITLPRCVIGVTAIADSSFAVDSAGGVWAWGDNTDGSLGLPDSWAYDKPKKLNIPPILNIWHSGTFSLAKTKTGKFWFWGWGGKNVVGIYQSEPVELAESINLRNFNSIFIDGEQTIASDKNTGETYVWGWTKFAFEQSPSFAQSPTKLNIQISGSVQARSDTYGILTKSGDLYTWGSNRFGALGTGADYWCSPLDFPDPPCLGWDLLNDDWYTVFTSPTKVLSNVKAFALGPKHSLAVDNNGIVWAWGRGTEGQLGTGTETNRLKPVRVMNLDLRK